MKQRLFASVLVLCLVILAGSASAHAQGAFGEIAVKVSFPFSVGDKSFPEGTYRVGRSTSGLPSLTLRAVEGNASAVMPVITRLAAQDHSAHEVKGSLVFDTVGDKKFLSEVWLPNQDGFLVHGTEVEHKHDVVRLKD